MLLYFLLQLLLQSARSATLGGNIDVTALAPAVTSPGQCQDSTACAGEMDLVFVMDGSGSITPTMYADAVEFIEDFAMSFAIDSTLVNFGMVQWSGNAAGNCNPTANPPTCDASVINEFITLELSSDVDKICTMINAPQIRDVTPTLRAIQVGHCVLLGSTRPSAAKFMVLLTDGSQSGTGGGTDAEIYAATDAIKSSGIKIFALNVANNAAATLMTNIASLPKADHYWNVNNFGDLMQSGFKSKFISQTACIPITSQPSAAPTVAPPPPNATRCECWWKPDLLACPIVRGMLDYECGGGTGSFFYDCTDEQHEEENAAYVLWNLLLWAYKVCFLLFLHFILGCHTVDLGMQDILCCRFKKAHIFIVLINLFLILLTYLSRCFMPIWAVFCFIWLHIDVVFCLIDRHLNKKIVRPPKPPPPSSNLELFAYTNHKKSWIDKAYNTIELKSHKKTLQADSGKKKKAQRAEAKRKHEISKKGFSFKGAGMI